MNEPLSSSLTSSERFRETLWTGLRPRKAASAPEERQFIGDPYPYFKPLLSKVTSFCDLLAVTLASIGWCLIWTVWLHDLDRNLAIVGGLVAVVTFVLLPRKQDLMAYPRIRRMTDQIRYLAPALYFSAILQFLILRILHAPTPRMLDVTASWFGLCAGVLVLTRGVETALLHTRAIERRLVRQIAVIGTGETAALLSGRIENDAGHTYGLLGQFDDAEGKGDASDLTGTIGDLVELSSHRVIHTIIIALAPDPERDEREIRNILWRLRRVVSDIYIVPYLLDGIDTNLPVEKLGPHSLLVLQRRPLSELQTAQKLAFDLLFGMVILALLWPVLLGVALAIKLDSKGPVFFRQPRIGFNNRFFTVYKFRSMYTSMTDLGAVKQTSRDDPRITPVGKWLRKFSIDELPQIFNVLSGEMSLVGPRPHAPHTTAGGLLLHDALAEYVMRHHVRPGITGWAQVNGSRGELVTLGDLRRRVALDLEYIQKWSLWLDIKIIILTALREVFSRNAF
ncbi:exopolysaccharide biosynthesis polyprenyl glycosylphosphotransferase [Acidomonas methanolica]|uniref:Polysaccharide biosynthesis glycosyltransferase n=1 Tax=Acidomonas methanolica NBRC 104435 TaxID=1231351 RepID=A0A023D3K4_ACIMT|nr:exopolysaccharide biosynthesis polyprenyl glycosylphosphotransferase [Acidomonas methanolica]MBU2654167.1 exopolysaccharide biosynthesis polyprenyl glycosylphosphotransferase [Acidomonas methanolica]TCS30602.1 Undecaprenyl-phosphate glucose phosphotransferase [Acidomonas methanolica]GAJ28355.1 polysaccharide biosynthesis glycosyltransferase [Acidomonas methanolica NBRC 104435]GBQ52414.1 sugar transferase [Acidomonas methanolica]GEK98839.1 undecaprenyl-phosphate glucose phosphotransferase [A